MLCIVMSFSTVINPLVADLRVQYVQLNAQLAMETAFYRSNFQAPNKEARCFPCGNVYL